MSYLKLGYMPDGAGLLPGSMVIFVVHLVLLGGFGLNDLRNYPMW
jgi:hypothetical protein